MITRERGRMSHLVDNAPKCTPPIGGRNFQACRPRQILQHIFSPEILPASTNLSIYLSGPAKLLALKYLSTYLLTKQVPTN